MNVVIAGGGTAGHVNPALALAGALEGHAVSFIGTARGAEMKLVPSAGFELDTVEVRGFDRSRPLSIFGVGLQATRAVGTSRQVLRRRDADVVVGMGGYVSLPAVIAASSLRVPVVLHEQNVVLGLANRVSKPLSRRVGVSFEETLRDVGNKGSWVGNPVASAFTSLDASARRASARESFGLDADRTTMLVFGGSQGARSINKAASGLAELWRDRGDLQILHVTGREAYQEVAATVGKPEGALIYRVEAYVEGMTDAYAAADLALCRGGATTVAELTVVGVPSLIVPYPYHRDRQQERHGRILESAGAARVLLDRDLTSERLAAEASVLLGDDARLSTMGAAALKLGRPDAAAALARLVEEVAAA
jgi:UDP-N-acetylglucosamine--N-acetylmuramyl-(pentapeptide) pyrophosphoryl-undecaprenol N-acetylglucosamine transferase